MAMTAAGYDTDDVPVIHCLNCHRPIGDAKWREVDTLARFGQMLFEHVVCPPNIENITEGL